MADEKYDERKKREVLIYEEGQLPRWGLKSKVTPEKKTGAQARKKKRGGIFDRDRIRRLGEEKPLLKA